MPQLDVATYLGQVTWFTAVFVRFYLAMVTDVLPSLNRSVKLRLKKLDHQRGELRQFDGVRSSAEEEFDGALGRSSKQIVSRLGAQGKDVNGSSMIGRSTSLSQRKGKLILGSRKAKAGK